MQTRKPNTSMARNKQALGSTNGKMDIWVTHAVDSYVHIQHYCI